MKGKWVVMVEGNCGEYAQRFIITAALVEICKDAHSVMADHVEIEFGELVFDIIKGDEA